MDLQLLLLLALVGPFCAFTHANPTLSPEDLTLTTETATHVTDKDATQMTVALEVTTDPPAAATSMVPEEVTTDVVQEMSTRLYTEAFTAAANTVAPEPLTTSAPAIFVVETEGLAETEQPIVTGVADSEMSEEVVVEGDTAEGLSSGQLVGIVIGALLAVVICIAVVIAVLRRMGKYSP